LSADTNDYEPIEDDIQNDDIKEQDSPKKDYWNTSFFDLSGGILREQRSDRGTSLDDLLYKLMSHTPNTRLAKHVDRNLDYLHTSLQLDLIRMVAEDIRPNTIGEEHAHKERIIRSLRGSPDIGDVHEQMD
jgi:hypothetical protein